MTPAALHRQLTSDEPSPDAIALADGFLRGVIDRRPWSDAALDSVESQLLASRPAPAELGPDEVTVVAAAAARHLAPLVARDGSWLSAVVRAPYCHVPGGTRLAGLAHAYQRSSGSRQRRRGLVENLLRRLGQLPGEPGGKNYLEALRLADAGYLLPNLLLALAQSPHRYLAETLATFEPTLTGELWRLPGWIAGCLAAADGAPAPSQPDQADVESLVSAALAEFEAVELVAGGAARYGNFRALLRQAVRLHRAELERACLAALRAPEQAMVDLIERKTPSARFAHGAAALNGTPLDRYFDRSPANSREIAGALAGSSWIRPGEPDRSPFLSTLTGQDAPMGKIFSAEDLAIIRRWISWLATPIEPVAIEPVAIKPVAIEPVEGGPADGAADAGPDTFDGPAVRQLFHQLVSSPDRAAATRQARRFVRYWLAEAARLPRPAFTWELPERYQSDEFVDWMHRTYRAMASAPVVAVDDSGEGHRARCFHGAADNLVDGAWLQGLTRRPSLSRGEQLLYDIYWDEIGEGRPGHSHGVLYEDLLESLGYRLPKFWTRRFVDEVEFLDEGFVAPVFRLAISEFPVSCYPEIVGVNLVCEFHGLGSAGIAKADDLTGLGFETGFTRLHIADDNVELGHSAKARDAVVLLMADAARLGVTELVWQRVRAGALAMRMAYVVLMQGRLGIAPTQVTTPEPAEAVR